MKWTRMIPATVLVLSAPVLANPANTKTMKAGAAKTTTATEQTTQAAPMPANLDKTKIMQVQKALNKNGFKVNVDGNWNQSTMDAIRSYQTKNALQVTGQADQPTLVKLGVNI